MKKLDFYFDFGSPTTFLAFKVLPRIAEKAEVSINWKPVLLGGIFKATGNQSPVIVPAKGIHMLTDMERFAKKYEVTIKHNPHFPINTLQLMRGATALLNTDVFQEFTTAMFDAIWQQEKNTGDATVVSEVLGEIGLNADEFMKKATDPAVKSALIDATDKAVKRGLFGVPTMFVSNEMFFGQDRLQFVAEALGISICDVFPNFVLPAC